ncbi:hypothetical protein HN51_047613 [Arachis hypogaea]|uniref:Uncharacterized protein n=1 Tax=Arachis hypogaea TaxID=3818 RepID=A0A445AHH0_ARAHY|nr:uncharacterized protein LOC107628314 [Arachis ipaensis]XP_025635992.1 uncharacterized protein LOC112730097 [Arachis hypogaea]QHO23969.1 uncharacterized protein DS421_12g368230 [Arachis hypogaea]RYR25855.1 hypothetical protein Ahy_B02g059875 [Arachis hypogaea]
MVYSSCLPPKDPGANIVVSKEEFNLFHNIDRQLFTRLVVGLGRDTSESAHVMSFIMWLERKCKDLRMVSNLLNWPDNLLNDLADEVALALNCIESPQFPYSHDKILPLVHNITRGTISLLYLHEIRMEVIPGVTKLLNDVCLRAFTDIIQQVHYENARKSMISNAYLHPPMMYYAPSPPAWISGGANSSARNDDQFNQEFKEILAKLHLTTTNAATSNEMRQVPAADDRTIFMTFSKGYPISESEVREFFTRAHGDIIESLHMQDVQSLEQPLFARMVVRPEAMNTIDTFLEGAGKVKFAINGKHVWARKYVPKENKSPSSGPSSPSSSTETPY